MTRFGSEEKISAWAMPNRAKLIEHAGLGVVGEREAEAADHGEDGADDQRECAGRRGG